MENISKILGFQSGHDVSYCILENGIPTIHEELERFTREKHALGDGLKMFYENFKGNKSDFKYFSFGNLGGRSGKWESECKNSFYDKLMTNTIERNKGKFFEFSHHMCHVSNAFFSSNFDSSTIITLDGGGIEIEDGVTACTIYKGQKNKIEKLKVFPFNEINIGVAWDLITKAFGLSVGYPYGSQAGTVMAMAGLSDCNIYEEPIREIIENGCFSNEKTIKCMKKIFEKDHSLEQNKFDIAHSLQLATESVVKDIICKAMKLFPSENLCIAGGCALNSVMIGKIKDWFPNIKNIYIPPIPTDAGLAIGSAQYLWHQIFQNPRIKWVDNFSPYLGRNYKKSEIRNCIKKFDNIVNTKDVSEDDVISLLEKQNIVSIFGKGSESGRRALGNRSILADPRSDKMKNIINKKVKHRQWYRPFAPSIIREEVKNWFTRDEDSPYMSMVLKWKKQKTSQIPAVNHFDNSARLQTVTENDNSWYYSFLKKWEKKTNVPILLNTSFNDSEPIVETPEHAINCFLKTEIDYLYFTETNTLVRKN